MTQEEWTAVEAAAPLSRRASLVVRPHTDRRFVRLSARPCPLLDGSRCSVYAVRPVNCRRWGCGRHDVTTEPCDVSTSVPARFYTDRPFRRQLVTMQREALRDWGHAHGWPA